MSTAESRRGRPTAMQKRYLVRGLDQPGGKLPLFDEFGQHYSERTVRSCIDQGWAEPWFDNPLKPDWTVCRLTEDGRALLAAARAPREPREQREQPEPDAADSAEVVALDRHRESRRAS